MLPVFIFSLSATTGLSKSSSSSLNYIQKFTIIEDRLNLLKRFNVSAINKGTLLNNVGRLGTSVLT
jgi:hypothetical protein